MPRHRHDLAVEPDVVVDELLDADGGIHALDLALQLGDLLVGAQRGGEAGCLRLQHPAHGEDLEHRVVVVHVDDERDRLQQQVGSRLVT